MPTYLHDYIPALYALSATVLLVLLQFAVADVARIRAKLVPGKDVEGGHDSFVFRAVRAHANTLENLGAFSLAALLAILVGADAGHVNVLAMAFAGARGAHMLLYYFDLRSPRSVAFGLGLIASALMIVTVLRQLIAY